MCGSLSGKSRYSGGFTMRLFRLSRLIVGALSIPGLVSAQERDPTGRYDVLEPADHLEDLLEEPDLGLAPGRPFTIDLALGGAFSTNAGQSRSAPVQTGVATPSLAIRAVPISLGSWRLRGSLTADGDYFVGDYNDRFGEGRLEARGYAEHELGPGDLRAGYRVLGGFSNDFAERNYTLQVTSLAYTVSIEALRGELSAEYHGSDDPNLRRTRVTSLLAYRLPEPQFGYDVTLGGMLQYSDFRAGDNSGRSDVTAQISLGAARAFSNGVSLGWFAAFSHRFSNRERSRFTEFDIGPTISKAF